MMRLWLDSFARPSFVASSATLSVAAHAVIIAAWVVATLPPLGMPSDGVANRTYPSYVPPPNREQERVGSRESIRYIALDREGPGTGDGPRTVGDERPKVTDLTIGSAPLDSVETPAAPAVAGTEDSVFTMIDVDSAVARSENSAAPEYPPALLSAHVMGFVAARYVVDTTGLADPASFEVLQSTNPAFVESVREALPGMRFKAAKIGPLKVKQLVEQTFSFRIDDSALKTPVAPPASAKRKPPGL